MKLVALTMIFVIVTLAVLIDKTNGETVTVPILATAKVVPMIGAMPNSMFKQSINKDILNIQTSRNSSLLLHIENSNLFNSSYLLSNSLKNINQKNSASEFYSFDLSQTKKPEDALQIITIITIDN